MIEQLTVYDENGAQVGMTFPKRARQLINKQRAVWNDDSHTSIRLLPEVKEEVPVDDYLSEDEYEGSPGFTGSDDLLLYLARKNVREKRNLIRHVMAYIAAWPIVGLFYSRIIIHTLHPSPSRWRTDHMNDMLRDLAYIRAITWSSTSRAAINNVYNGLQTLVDQLTHPIMNIIFGIMIAWGFWIAVRIVNHIVMLRSRRAKTTRLDPVQQEYRRLKGMAEMKF